MKKVSNFVIISKQRDFLIEDFIFPYFYFSILQLATLGVFSPKNPLMEN